ncbi:hypothetical protein LEP1GSC188_0322 [Leptospira weilii serovar Topaz str. LT2116]|uniref:Uncharacterized protein n=1 Tax=Leptospira weilii serovar Topaz str. LT2116 TaxID=1088540 RepID=M3G9M1_9LEPT|nr:hypothetical protein LEP1GSC188_0322 [Leptospira weilii serovar Topaz str. LT2116]
MVRLLREVKKVYSFYGARTVRKVMKLCEIRGKQEKRFRIATTDSKHKNRIAPDLEPVSKLVVQRKRNNINVKWTNIIQRYQTHFGKKYPLLSRKKRQSRKVVAIALPQEL